LICLTRPVSAVKDTPTLPIVEGNLSPGVFSASVGQFGKGFFLLRFESILELECSVAGKMKLVWIFPGFGFWSGFNELSAV
jgi:hypothetical protein